MTQQISWDEFDEQYKPIQNHLDDNASFGGIMFDFGRDDNDALIPEYQYVWDLNQTEPNRVWTVVCDTENRDDDDNLVSITDVIAGWHIVNRLGYIVTENAWTDEYLEVINTDFDDDYDDI
jgi:hypothetical protein